MNCFDKIIGISRTTNECWADDLSEDARASNSGLYLDENIEGFLSLDTFKQLAAHNHTTLEAFFNKQITSAKQLFLEALNKHLGEMYTVKHKAYVGNVGNNSWNNTMNVAFAHAGLALDMEKFVGADVVITGFKPHFNFDGAIAVKLYQAYNTGVQYQIVQEMATYNLNTLISTPALQLITPITLPTTDDAGKAYSYLFIYALPGGGVQPRDNKTSCGCGDKESTLFKYLRPYGIQGVDKDTMLIANRTDRVHGLQVMIQAMCTGGDYICQEYYNNPQIRKVIEWQILRKAAALAMTEVITSTMVHHETMSRRESIGMTINILNSHFKNNVNWIAQNINVFGNQCFTCNVGGSTGQELTKGGILL